MMTLNLIYAYKTLFLRQLSERPGGSIPVRVIPMTSKMVLDAALLNTQQYKVRIKSKVEVPVV